MNLLFLFIKKGKTVIHYVTVDTVGWLQHSLIDDWKQTEDIIGWKRNLRTVYCNICSEVTARVYALS